MIRLANLLKEITVNKPGSKFKVETYRDVSDGIIYAYTLLPIDILELPVEFDCKAPVPIAVLEAPVVLVYKDKNPIAVLLPPDVLAFNALLPDAKL
jgi:hypothetical protein